MERIRIARRIFSFVLFLAALFAAGSAGADPWHTTNKLLGHALPDECYAGLGGVDYPGGITPCDGFTTPVVCPESVDVDDPENPGNYITRRVYPKANDTYVWALTEEGDSLWFASAANVFCTTGGIFLEQRSYGEFNLTLYRGLPVYANHTRDDLTGTPTYTINPPAAPIPLCFGGPCATLVCTNSSGVVGTTCDSTYKINNYRMRVPYGVCEYGDSMIARNAANYPGINDDTGDWRPSKLFRYVKATGALENLTDKIYAAGHGAVIDGIQGVRSAGSLNGVVLFAGGRNTYSGVTFFAFRASDGQYLGYRTYSNYRQIRKMIVINNQLYTGVGNSWGAGEILLWRGTITNPHSWVRVGLVSGTVTELAAYVANEETRIVANAAGGLYVSPAMVNGYLWPINAYRWRRIWQPSVYEPDTYARQTYGPGALGQLGEWIYWGTMHIPYHASLTNAIYRFGSVDNVPQTVTGKTPSGSDRTLDYDLFYGTARTTSVWRARNLKSSNPEIQLVYGETHLGAWNGTTWFPVPTGWTPLNMPSPAVTHSYFGTPVGSSGFFNASNNYSWTVEAANFNDGTGPHLFFGTMDQAIIDSTDVSGLAPSFSIPPTERRGADLWRFSLGSDGTGWGGASATAAQAEFINGAGNALKYGVRCLGISDDKKKLYLGMASAGGLMNPSVVSVPWMIGGWELRELSRQP